MLFFQPAVWLVTNWVRREREACCDAVVVGRTQRPHAYAELLVALASQLPRSVLFHPAAASAMAAGPLRGRIRRILGIEDDPMLISGKSLGVVMSGLLLGGDAGGAQPADSNQGQGNGRGQRGHDGERGGRTRTISTSRRRLRSGFRLGVPRPAMNELHRRAAAPLSDAASLAGRAGTY